MFQIKVIALEIIHHSCIIHFLHRTNSFRRKRDNMKSERQKPCPLTLPVQQLHIHAK